MGDLDVDTLRNRMKRTQQRLMALERVAAGLTSPRPRMRRSTPRTTPSHIDNGREEVVDDATDDPIGPGSCACRRPSLLPTIVSLCLWFVVGIFLFLGILVLMVEERVRITTGTAGTGWMWAAVELDPKSGLEAIAQFDIKIGFAELSIVVFSVLLISLSAATAVQCTLFRRSAARKSKTTPHPNVRRALSFASTTDDTNEE